MGEPVVIYEAGLAHRFRNTCENYVEDSKKKDIQFLTDCGIDPEL